MAAHKERPLVSILVGLAVLAVLAAIGVPAWHGHTVGKHVDEALKAANAAKLVVMEAAATSGSLERVKASDLSYNPAAVANPYVARVEIADGGNITLVTQNTGASPDPVLLLAPNEESSQKSAAPIRWRCNVIAGDPHVLPADCGQDRIAGSATPPTAPAATASVGASK